jgi:hypothetical protein
MKLTQVLHEENEFVLDVSPIDNDRNTVIFQPNDNQPAISTQQNTDNPPDKITLDVPLLIRLLEWAREDAKDDIQLHKISEKLVELSRLDQTLSMKNYREIIMAGNHKHKHK